jgi:hypothetical protein
MITAHVLSRTPSMVRGDNTEKNTINGIFSRHWGGGEYIYIYMCVCVCVCVCTYKGKGKVHPTTGHEGPERE